jgi:hypothetical protein
MSEVHRLVFFLVDGGTARGFFCPGFSADDFGPQYRRPATVLHTISSVVGGLVTLGLVVGRTVVVGLTVGAATEVVLPPGAVGDGGSVLTVGLGTVGVLVGPGIVELVGPGTNDVDDGTTDVVETDGGHGNSNHDAAVGEATSSGPQPAAWTPVNWNEAETLT